MSKITQKGQYAVRATLQLAQNYGKAPLSVASIAEKQSIPARFLEQIIAELRRAKIVSSHRGAHGGYTLNIRPDQLNMAQIIHLIDGEPRPVDCISCGGEKSCELGPDCVFAPVWIAAHQASNEIYKKTSFQELLDQLSILERSNSQRS